MITNVKFLHGLVIAIEYHKKTSNIILDDRIFN